MEAPMKTLQKRKSGLDKKFQKVSRTPASFAFFVAIHDFIEYIELDTFLAGGLSQRIKTNKELNIPNKYDHLRMIYQGVEDTHPKSDVDLGHDRYSVVRELSKIQNKDFSNSNTFWKKRDLFRRLTGEVYDRLVAYLSE
jgi:hypothetical protein